MPMGQVLEQIIQDKNYEIILAFSKHFFVFMLSEMSHQEAADCD